MLIKHKLKADEIKSVVVRGTNWVGDAVMTIPALRELRRVLPLAHITLATRSGPVGLFDEAEFLDDLLVYDRGRKPVRALIDQIGKWRRKRFDLAVLFQNAFEAALLATAGGIPARVGYATDGRGLLLTHAVARPQAPGHRHEVFYYLNIVSELEKVLCGESDVMERAPVFDLKVSEARQEEARDLLIATGASPTRPLIALCPGSTNSRAKRWPADRYAELGDKIIGEMGADVALVGAPNEIDVALEVRALMRLKPVMLTGRTDLAQAVAILSLADALITNDTGPAHIAAALNRPTIVIFGPTDPTTTSPFSPVADVIRHPPDCAPCMLRDCPIDHRCMTAITPDEVFVRVNALIKQHYHAGAEA